jgi:hypothetical protein
MQKNSEERNQFFKELYEKCSNETVYSVIETAESMGVSYEQVETWARNKKLNRILQKCRAMCAQHTRDSFPSSTFDYEKYTRYLLENDDDEAQAYADAQEKFRLEKEAERKAAKIKEEQEKERRKGITLARYPDSIPQKNESKTSSNLPGLAVIQNNQLSQWHEQRTLAEEERLTVWREKQAKEHTGHCVQKNEAKSTDETIYLEPKFDNPDLTYEEKSDIYNATLCAATGTSNALVADIIISSASTAIHRSNWPDIAQVTTATQDALLAMNPNDLFEGMLCSRLWVLHNQSMHYMNRAALPDASTTTIDLNINRAAKLMRVHTETLEALNKHRRKGEQKVTVQHVNVGNGGQAIVTGEFTRGGGVNAKK